MYKNQIKSRMSVSEARAAGLLPPQISTPPNNAAALSVMTLKPRSRPVMTDKAGDISPPQTRLTLYVKAAFGEQVVAEFKPLADRQIRLDLAFPSIKLGVEINGWTNHGKSLKAFRSDHLRTQDLMIDGWVILPFAAGDVMENIDRCIGVIEKTIMAIRKRNGDLPHSIMTDKNSLTETNH